MEAGGRAGGGRDKQRTSFPKKTEKGSPEQHGQGENTAEACAHKAEDYASADQVGENDAEVRTLEAQSDTNADKFNTNKGKVGALKGKSGPTYAEDAKNTVECDAKNGEPKQGSKSLPAYSSTSEGSPTLLLHSGRVRGPDSVEEVGVAGEAEGKKKLHRHREAS